MEQDTFAFRSGEFPFAATRLVENGRAPGPELFRIVGDIPVAVPIEEILIRADKEGPRAAGRIEDAEFGCLFRRFVFEQCADGVLNDVIDDVSRRVVNAPGFLDLRFVFDFGLVAFREADDLPRNCSYTWPRISAGRTENS